MAVTPTLLTHGTAGTGNTPSTASVTPGSNRLILIGVTLRGTDATAGALTAIGNGITYTEIAKVVFGAIGNRVLYVFRGMAASPSTGAIAFSYSGDGTAVAWTWTVDHSDEVKTTGSNGADAVGSVATNTLASGTSIGVTITGTPVAGDVTWGIAGVVNDPTDVASEAGWSNISHQEGAETQHDSVWDVDQDQTASWSWTLAAQAAAAVGILIKAASAASAALTGTATASITEADIVAGGKTIIVTLTGAQWIP